MLQKFIEHIAPEQWAKNHRQRVLHRPLILLSCALLLCICSGIFNNLFASVSEEYKIKAAFIPNFARFTTWPDQDSTAGQFVFLIVGNNPFGQAINPINSQEFYGKGAAVRFAQKWHIPDDDVKVMFISRNMEDVLEEILEDIKARPILTISDIKGFADAGGMIELLERDGSIHFIVNIAAIRASGLDMNYQILQLADKVIGQ